MRLNRTNLVSPLGRTIAGYRVRHIPTIITTAAVPQRWTLSSRDVWETENLPPPQHTRRRSGASDWRVDREEEENNNVYLSL